MRLTRTLTHLGGARATVLTGLLLVAAGGDGRRVGLTALLGNSLSHLLVQALKRAVARPRPCDANGTPLALVELPDPFSFPSGHSAAAFATVLPIAVTWPWTAAAALGAAGLVAASRVTLKVHYVGDVLAGIALGIGGYLAAQALIS